MQISNSAKGNPYHNAFVESFMKTLKQEEVYNEKRVHSGIDYLTPSELEEGIKTDPSLASRFMLQLLSAHAIQFTARTPVEPRLVKPGEALEDQTSLIR